MMNGNGMLEVGSGLMVLRNHAPVIVEQRNLAISHSNHRLNRYTQTVFQLLPRTTRAVIGNLWALVHFMANSMAYEFAHDPITLSLCVLLHRISYIPQPLANYCLLYTLIQGFFGRIQQLTYSRRHFTNSKCVARISTKAIEFYPAIDRDDVSLLQWGIIWYAMHYDLIN